MTHYKATNLNGTDFYSRKIDYAAALKAGRSVVHPKPGVTGGTDATFYLSVSTIPTDCTGFSWPARLFEVEAEGASWTPDPRGMPNKRAAHSIRVLAELPAWQLFGPRGEGCVSILDHFATLTHDERQALNAAQDSAWSNTWSRLVRWPTTAGLFALGLGAARDALGDRLDGWGGGRAASGAALAVLLSGFPDLMLSTEDYATLTAPWRTVVGKAHPADELPAKHTPRKVAAK